MGPSLYAMHGKDEFFVDLSDYRYIFRTVPHKLIPRRYHMDYLHEDMLFNYEPRMITIGQQIPEFDLTAVVSNDVKTAFQQVSNDTYKGKWLCLFAWPKDFTFVCPTEIAAFGAMNEDFQDRDCQILGLSTDSEFVHLAWRNDHKDLKDLPFPMLSDIKRELSEEMGILNEEAGVCNRVTLLVDPEGIVRHVSVNDLSVGRNPQEILRILDALQTDELCPCNWEKGEDTLQVA
jgi:peroxiredoxin (alkyl hydroperoxide reductase subunit C)